MGGRRNTHKLPPEAVGMIAARFRLLGEPNRLRLLMALEGGEKTVTELVAETGCGQANVSRHLQSLSDAGILARRKEGRHVYYRIAEEKIFALCDLVCGSLQRRMDAQARVLRGGR